MVLVPRTQGNRGAHDDLDDECEDNGDGLGSGDVILNDLCYNKNNGDGDDGGDDNAERTNHHGAQDALHGAAHGSHHSHAPEDDY